MFNLLPYLSILDNVLLPLSFAPERRRRAKTRGSERIEAERLLKSLGLDLAALGMSKTAELSIGQQQRVAAARALIGAPEIVVADEPTSALDRDRQEAFLSLLFAELERVGSTLIMVSHEQHFAGRFDRVVELESLQGLPQDKAPLQSRDARAA
jgi:putative ABC transport system ATP-binding protein